MHGHFTYFNNFISDPNFQKFFTAGLLVLAILFFAFLAYRKVVTEEQRKKYIIPKRFSLVGIFDFFVEAFVGYQDSILGSENRKYASFTGSVFILILLSNLVGLIPGMPAITTTVIFNLGIALSVFVYFNYLGIKQNGLVGYLKHFCGPIIFLAPLIFSIELFSTCLRVLTLNLRLYWNISADHLLMSTFIDLLPISGVFMYLLGFFVAFVQAFVFTTLTIIYIQLAVQHSEE